MNVQSSQWNVGGSASFTINLGVYFPAVAELEGSRLIDRPAENVCHLQQRIGWLMPEPLDRWWDIDCANDVPALGSAVAETVEAFALPWLEGHSTMSAAADADCAWPRYRALLLWCSGRRDEAWAYTKEQMLTGGLAHAWLGFARRIGREDEARALLNDAQR